DGLIADLDYERTAYLDLDGETSGEVRAVSGLGRVAVDMTIIGVLAEQGAAGRAPQRLQERIQARAGTRIALSSPPLAAVDRETFAVHPAVTLDGQARVVEMLADQRLTPGAQLVEEFELVGTEVAASTYRFLPWARRGLVDRVG